jgi:hypothetical protein
MNGETAHLIVWALTWLLLAPSVVLRTTRAMPRCSIRSNRLRRRLRSSIEPTRQHNLA